MFKKISLKVKLITAFLAIASLVLVLSYINVQAIRTIHNAYDEVVDTQVPTLSALQEMLILTEEIKTQMIIYGQHGASEQEVEHQKNELLSNLERLMSQESRFESLISEHTDHDLGTAQELQAKLIASAREAAFSNIFELISLKEQQADHEIIDSHEDELITMQLELREAIDGSIDKTLSHIELQDETADAQVDDLVNTGIMFSALSGVFALLIGVITSFSIGRRLKSLREGSERIANGDFSHTIAIKAQDEIGALASDFNRMSARLQTSYQRLAFESKRDETLLESMNEGLIALDSKGQIVLMNSVAAQLSGHDPNARPVGKLFSEAVSLRSQQDKAVPPEQLPGAMTLKSGQMSQAVFSYALNGKAKTLIDITASPVVMDTRIAGAILVLRDVTREKEIDRMKTEFISLASHQLRTPLSAIKWFSEMLLSGDAGKLKEEQADFAKNISDSTERMIQLVNSLLNISRMESGRIIVDPKPTDLKDLVSDIINDLTAKTKEKQQTLIISVHAELPKINLDPHLIGQVYLNLLTNAIKYTPKGGEISVFISKKNDQIISQVTDNGYGIPKADQSRIFQKFFRAENITKHETDGTGLGLYLIKSIIESSNGKIWFKSEEDEGATFWFSLPLSGMKPQEGEVTLEM